MLRRVSILAAVLSLASLAAVQESGGSFKIDPVHSSVVFNIQHAGASHVWGRINDPSGTIVVSGDKLEMNVELDISKIDTANKGRDEHLRGADYFNVKQYPKATFKSTASKSASADTYEVVGDLTIKDVTKSITVTVKKIGEGEKGPQMGYRAGFETSFTIKKSEYNVAPDGKGLGDEVPIMLSLEGKR